MAENVLRYGTGVLNIDGCRISSLVTESERRTCKPGGGRGGMFMPHGDMPAGERHNPSGRWPANVILEHLPGCRQVGTKKVNANQSSRPGSGRGHKNTEGHGIYHGVGGVVRSSTADENGLEEVVAWECHPDCPVKALDDQASASGLGRSAGDYPSDSCGTGDGHTYLPTKPQGKLYDDKGGASRFFKQVKR